MLDNFIVYPVIDMKKTGENILRLRLESRLSLKLYLNDRLIHGEHPAIRNNLLNWLFHFPIIEMACTL